VRQDVVSTRAQRPEGALIAKFQANTLTVRLSRDADANGQAVERNDVPVEVVRRSVRRLIEDKALYETLKVSVESGARA